MQERADRVRVEAGGDVFFVTVTGEAAVARNFATGIGNQARLIQNAARAIATHTGCPVEMITQRPLVNVYDAVLDCP